MAKMKKLDVNSRFELMRMITAVVIGLIATAIVVALTTDDVGEALYSMFLGPLERTRYMFNVLELAVPLIFTGVAISIMFSAKQFNLASEGIFYVGGMIGAVVAIDLSLPKPFHAIVAVVLGGAVGALIGAIPGVLKHKLGASELVTSLMLNYLCFNTVSYVIKNIYRDASAGFTVSYVFEESAQMTKVDPLYRLTIGEVAIAIMVVVGMYLFLYNTRWGYTIRTAGQNMSFVKFSGLSTGFAVVGSQMIGGMIAGLGGATEMLSLYTRFEWQALLGYGWDGVIVAIFAKNNPKYVPIAAIFLAYLRIGGDIMMRRTDVQMEIIEVVQALLIILLVAERFLSSMHHKMVVKDALAKEVQADA